MQQQPAIEQALDPWISRFPQLVYSEASNSYLLPVQPKQLLFMEEQRRQFQLHPAMQQSLPASAQRPHPLLATQQPLPSLVPSSHHLPEAQQPPSSPVPMHRSVLPSPSPSPGPSQRRYHSSDSHHQRVIPSSPSTPQRHESSVSHCCSSLSKHRSPSPSPLPPTRSQRLRGEHRNPQCPSSPNSTPLYRSISPDPVIESDENLDWSPTQVRPPLNTQSSSPSDDARAFADQILRMARTLDLKVTEDEEASDQLEKRVQSRVIDRPVIPYMLSLAKILKMSC
ncbi:hypothetical protein JD844_023382 [Phrynosoma platyrhinos]|uniref:Uncharacterized protein n=1 Tax=Phrynosoma platyrhinos TaxID=52577 RepID=A0ABQ7SWF7_PHRPL|nr:hypothetical protein JD844_023382 [Phrynosoma platyrhinos]